MSGEITLTGDVLKVGSIKEKSIAAKRNGIKTLIVPKDNFDDLLWLEDDLKNNIDFKLVSNYKDVYDIIFKNS